MSNKLTAYLESQMQSLKLKGMLTHYQEITEKASQNNLSYTEYLSLLFEEELKRKNEGTVKTKINKARFPFIKTLEEFDFSFQPSIREKEIISLSSLDFVEKKENIIFLGPPGVGKSHLSVALGIKACMAKYRVVFITAQKLLEELLLSAKDGSLLDKLLGYSRLNLLIIDELGYMPVTKEQAIKSHLPAHKQAAGEGQQHPATGHPPVVLPHRHSYATSLEECG
jgi:DNA replication protein DnaC